MVIQLSIKDTSDTASFSNGSSSFSHLPWGERRPGSVVLILTLHCPSQHYCIVLMWSFMTCKYLKQKTLKSDCLSWNPNPGTYKLCTNLTHVIIKVHTAMLMIHPNTQTPLGPCNFKDLDFHLFSVLILNLVRCGPSQKCEVPNTQFLSLYTHYPLFYNARLA